jgi:hypothetical protein
MKIPIYDVFGNTERHVQLPEEVTFVNGRVSKGKAVWYKGVGVPYKGHHMNPPPPKDGPYTFKASSGVFYLGDMFSYKPWEGKFGIFEAAYQPMYTDWIGACGVKEGISVLNSSGFELCSADIKDFVLFDEENYQGYYIIDYLCGRVKFPQNPDHVALMKLLEYMMSNDWNFLWDKNSIEDISANGLITDPADVFKSNDLVHKFGTVYSVLYSLYAKYPTLFYDFLNINGVGVHQGLKGVVWSTIDVLEKLGVSTPLEKSGTGYLRAVTEYILPGRNCAHCACDMYRKEGDEVMAQYYRIFKLPMPEKLLKKC